MQEDHTLAVVSDIRRKLDARAVSIRWPSSENLSSMTPRKSHRRGPGFEYESNKVFDANDGDDARHIDWNATASEPDDDTFIVRTFRRPRVVRMSVLLDVNPSMNLGTKGTLKSLLGALCAGCGIASAAKVKDRASFVTYADSPVTILKARNASALLMPALVHSVKDRQSEEIASETRVEGGWRSQLLGTIRGVAARLSSATVDGAMFGSGSVVSSETEGGGLALSLRTVQQANRSLVVVVSDFVNNNEDDWEALRVCGMRHETIAVFVQDRREKELPRVPWPGAQFSLEDFRGRTLSLWVAPEGSPQWFMSLLRRLFGSVTTASQYAENFRRHEEAILARLTECAVQTLTVTTDEEDEAVQGLLGMLANKMRS